MAKSEGVQEYEQNVNRIVDAANRAYGREQRGEPHPDTPHPTDPTAK